MMRMTNTLFGTGKSVVIESGFCVLKGLVGMLTHGLYGMTVIKKKNPKQWKVNYIEVCFRDEEVGDVYDVYGDLDGHKYKIQCIKDDEYFMNLFGTHGVMSKRCR